MVLRFESSLYYYFIIILFISRDVMRPGKTLIITIIIRLNILYTCSLAPVPVYTKYNYYCKQKYCETC